MVVLDEINYAIGYGMLDPAAVAEALRNRPEMVHVILTGRNAHPLLVELAPELEAAALLACPVLAPELLEVTAADTTWP